MTSEERENEFKEAIAEFVRCGEEALLKGDNPKAKKYLKAAGDHLLSFANLQTEPTEKNWLYYWGALYYYVAGHYNNCVSTLEAVTTDILDENKKKDWRELYEEAKIRLGSDYWARLNATLETAIKSNEYKKVLDILKEHPYFINNIKMAELRQWACKGLAESDTGNNKALLEAAESFNQDAQKLKRKYH